MVLSTIFLKALNIYLFLNIFQKVRILMLRWNILQYFNCNEILEIFPTCFCNTLCYVSDNNGKIMFLNLPRSLRTVTKFVTYIKCKTFSFNCSSTQTLPRKLIYLQRSLFHVSNKQTQLKFTKSHSLFSLLFFVSSYIVVASNTD